MSKITVDWLIEHQIVLHGQMEQLYMNFARQSSGSNACLWGYCHTSKKEK